MDVAALALMVPLAVFVFGLAVIFAEEPDGFRVLLLAGSAAFIAGAIMFGSGTWK